MTRDTASVWRFINDVSPPRLPRVVAASAMAGCALMLACAVAAAQERFSQDQIRKGAAIFDRNCAPCHGPRMLDAQVAFDLRNFPPGEKNRFVTSVMKGKSQMPPWGDLFKADDIEALWAYVIAGEK